MDMRRYIVLVICGLLSLAAAGQAQEKDRMGRTLAMLREKLSLSDAQSARVRDILASYEAGLRGDTQGTRTARRLHPMEVSKGLKNVDRRIDAVLTPEQRAKFPDIRKELHSRLDPRHDRSLKRKQ